MLRWRQVSWTFQHFNFLVILRLPGARIPDDRLLATDNGWNVPLIRDGKVIERPTKQATPTKRYTEEAVNFIREKKAGPFFLYFAHTFPHVPLFAPPVFKSKSRSGIYGDAVEELDWSVG